MNIHRANDNQQQWPLFSLSLLLDITEADGASIDPHEPL